MTFHLGGVISSVVRRVVSSIVLNTASKRFKLAEVGDSVIIPISQPDKVHSLCPRNILGCITSRDESSYSIGTNQGTLAVKDTSDQKF